MILSVIIEILWLVEERGEVNLRIPISCLLVVLIIDTFADVVKVTDFKHVF